MFEGGKKIFENVKVGGCLGSLGNEVRNSKFELLSVMGLEEVK